MSLITNFNINQDLLTFNLNNNTKKIKISLANAIRRIIISEINTYTINENEITFYENTSMLDTEFLKTRLSLIPIISNIKDFDYENLIIGCKKENKDENMMCVYVKDFYCKNNTENIEITQIISYSNILFAKLAHNQNFSFECKLKKSNQKISGGSHCPVSTCIYRFKIDNNMIQENTKNMNSIEKKSYMTQDAERIYERNDIGEPNIYEFFIESIGFYDSKDLLLLSLEILIDKLMFLKSEFIKKNSDKINILDNEMDFYYFLINDENDTMGNLIQSYINNNNNVFYCGYLIEHPLKHNFLLKIKLKEDNNIENVLLIINQTIDEITNILNEIITDIKKF